MSQTPTAGSTALLPEGLQSAIGRPFKHVVVFSGAGISADSGIPTFRGSQNGLWSHFDPEHLATPGAFRQNKALVWAWYEWRRGLVTRSQPNAGHLAAAELQRKFGARVITQNVDDLHERGGASDVLHLHGSLFAPRCFACARPFEDLPKPAVEPQLELIPPRCEHCGGYIRPGVTWFGEQLDNDVVRAATEAIRQCNLLLVVGTSGVVYPAAGLVEMAPRSALVIEINPIPSETPGRIDYRIPATAALGLPAIASSIGRQA